MKNLKIQQLLFITIVLFFFTENTAAQYKLFKINNKGDTINAVSQKGVKQGKWVIRTEELRGEPGYEEEGVFK
ncbi:MAG: hypothetical protein H7320_05240, partial [Ferruginibacter sp.]|nr:hypothetical protein [Ferruginibacter sp.]